MTEKEKMLKQILYDANYDQNLLEERTIAKDLCYEYNLLRPSEQNRQIEIMKKLGSSPVSVGENLVSTVSQAA
ncbi:MAG: hypothetical protein IJ521_09340 [Schwartzia sp.]|nr:hypothetical protein [Schwartzia sp. (in: firmicutes)]